MWHFIIVCGTSFENKMFYAKKIIIKNTLKGAIVKIGLSNLWTFLMKLSEHVRTKTIYFWKVPKPFNFTSAAHSLPENSPQSFQRQNLGLPIYCVGTLYYTMGCRQDRHAYTPLWNVQILWEDTPSCATVIMIRANSELCTVARTPSTCIMSNGTQWTL